MKMEKLEMLIQILNESKILEINTTNRIAAMPSRFGTIIGAITAFFFIIFGLLSDLLIIVAILHKKKSRNNPTNIFIVSLQLNDIWNMVRPLFFQLKSFI